MPESPNARFDRLNARLKGAGLTLGDVWHGDDFYAALVAMAAALGAPEPLRVLNFGDDLGAILDGRPSKGQLAAE
ncbi:MAG: hypothetical protein KJ749_10070 [Planctomycetes bacterium]|nr:hypothetical protein [Planctomycetota bacterium]